MLYRPCKLEELSLLFMFSCRLFIGKQKWASNPSWLLKEVDEVEVVKTVSQKWKQSVPD